MGGNRSDPPQGATSNPPQFGADFGCTSLLKRSIQGKFQVVLGSDFIVVQGNVDLLGGGSGVARSALVSA